VLPVFGGQPIGRQLQVLRRGVDVVVATPGRAIDHIKRGSLDLQHVEAVVLDEADEMLDMGFADDLDEILGGIPEQRQTVLFSATMPPRIAKIARSHMTNPSTIEVAHERIEAGSTPKIRQVAYYVHRAHKPAALGRILDVESPQAAIVFCRTRVEVDQLAETLNGRGYRCEPLHGGLNQQQRDRVMSRVRNGTAELLIATDVAARGLDIDLLTHVVNYDVPSAPEAYVHRIGRVGRAGREGVAVTLAEPREQRLLRNIERETGQSIAIEKVPTVEELRAKQLEATFARLVERLESARSNEEIGIDGADATGEERYAEVLDRLMETFELRDIAEAAIGAAHEAEASMDDLAEIPVAEPRQKSRDAGNKGPSRGRGDRSGDRWGERSTGRYSDRPGDRPKQGGRDRAEMLNRPPAEGKARLWIGAGAGTGLRPGDIVGAIANECDLGGNEIGPILVSERFSLVEVPERSAGEVLRRLRATTIRGEEVKVRRDRFGGSSGSDSEASERRGPGRRPAPRRQSSGSEWEPRPRRKGAAGKSGPSGAGYRSKGTPAPGGGTAGAPKAKRAHRKGTRPQ
jgi:ATP-dependent RNA helicase DeaD